MAAIGSSADLGRESATPQSPTGTWGTPVMVMVDVSLWSLSFGHLRAASEGFGGS